MDLSNQFQPANGANPASGHPQLGPGTGPAPEQPDQWLDATLTLRSELKFDSRTEDVRSFVVIEDPVRSKYFQVGDREYRFIASLDGKLTPRQLGEQLDQDNDVKQYDDESLKAICAWLVQNNLAVGAQVDNAKRLNQQAGSMKKAKLVGLLNPISCKFNLFNPNQCLSAIQPYTQWLFSKWFAIIWCVFAVCGFSTIYSQWDNMGSASTGILSGYSWIWLLLTWVLLKVIHEAAHGVACRRYGGEVPEAGVLLLLFTPMAFVNVTSMWRFPNRWHRMVVSGAGMYVELFISFVAIILWSQTEGIVADISFNVFISASLTTILFNANPLMRFDGYFLLSDAIAIPNLYTKGTKWFGDRVKALFFGLPKTPNLYAKEEFKRIAIYGCMAYFWKFSISISLIIGAGVLFQGAGLALSAVGVALWFGIPIFRQFKSVFGPQAQVPVRPLRVAASFLTLGLIGLAFFYVLKAPATKSAPAIVQFSNEMILRAGADGFIKELKVQDGDKVVQGQTLIVLENPSLSNEVKELERLANEAKIQSRIFNQQKELSLSMAELKHFDELNEQLEEKRQQASGLRIVAPYDGFVFKRNLDNEIGNFARRGDPIISVAQHATKEVVVSIDQRDLESIKSEDRHEMRIAFPGVDLMKSQLTRINPRATQEPTHESLCASAGGPLPVRPVAASSEDGSDSQGFELLMPRFTVVLELDPESSHELESGQRGRAFFSTKRQSLGGYFYIAASDWLKSKIEIATQTALF
jgi:putative peptide zinc metalloprotease protein